MPGLLLTPKPVSARANNTGNANSKVDSEWSFHFRGGCQSDSDSSDEESGPPKAASGCDNATLPQTVNKDGTTSKPESKVEVETEDARLLRELDIASRASADAAQFTATPWSIARVNAASRAPVPVPASPVTSSVSSKRDLARAGGDLVDSAAKSVYGRQRYGPAFDVRRESAGGSAAAADGARKTDIKPKLGKTIERFFAARKLDKGNFKNKFKASDINGRRIQQNASTGAHPSLRPPQNDILHNDAPTLSAIQARTASPLPAPNYYPPFNQGNPVEHSIPISPTYTDTNIARPAQTASEGISTVSPANSAEIFTFISNSNDIEILDGSALGAEETEGFIYDAPCNNSTNNFLASSSFAPPVNQHVYPQDPSVYANSKPFNDGRQARTIPLVHSNVTQTSLRLTNSQPIPSGSSLSSPLRHDGKPSSVRATANTTSMERPLSGSNPTSPNTEMFHTLPNIGGVRHSQGHARVMHPGHLHSFSSPIRQPNRDVQHSGRAALGLAPPRFQNPSVNEYSAQSNRSRSRSPIGAIVHDQSTPPQFHEVPFTMPRHADRAEPVQHETYDQPYPVKDERNYGLPVAEPDFAFIHPKVRKPIANSSPPSLSRHHTERSSLSPRRAPLDHPHSIKRPRENNPPRNTDAYTAFAEDDDANWSTLPQRKKARTQASSSGRTGPGVKQSGRFKLPIALPSLAAKSVTNEPTANGKRRVVTYLPPPREPPSQASDRNARIKAGAPTISNNKVSEKWKGIAQNAEVRDVKVTKPVSQWSIKRFGYGHGAPRTSAGGSKPTLHSEGIPAKMDTLDDEARLLSREGAPNDSHADPPRRRPAPAVTPNDETDSTLCSSATDNGALSPVPDFSAEALDHDASNEDDDDVSVAFDAESLERSYPEARRAILEVRGSLSN